jgi:hypothetical protein
MAGVFDDALDKRFTTASPELTLANVDGVDVLLIHNAADGLVYKIQASTLASFINAAVSQADILDALDAPNGVATLDSGGKVPAAQLPAYVDDVLEYATASAFPVAGEAGKIYVALDTNLTYRWSGSAYVEISKSLALGETSSTAYRGDRGKTAYDHSQTSGNPHGTSKADVGLGNADNTSDANKPVSTAQQTALNAKANKAGDTFTGPVLVNATENVDFGARRWFQKAYSAPAGGTPVTIEVTKGGTALVAGNAYKVNLAIQGTGTSAGACYIVYATSAGTWVARRVAANTSSSNYPQLQVSGTTLQVFQLHASNAYTIQTFVETYTHGNATALNPTFFGLDAVFQYDVNGDVVGMTGFFTQPSWTAPTLQGTWANFGGSYEAAGYMKDRNGFVHLKGLVKTGSGVIFNLPVGHRPSEEKIFASIGNGTLADIRVSTNGDVSMYSGNSAYLSLSGIVFQL